MKLKRKQLGHIGEDGPGSDERPRIKPITWFHLMWLYVLGIFVSFLTLAVWVVPDCYVKRYPSLPVMAANVAGEAWMPSMIWPISWLAYYGVYRSTGSLCGSGLSKEQK